VDFPPIGEPFAPVLAPGATDPHPRVRTRASFPGEQLRGTGPRASAGVSSPLVSVRIGSSATSVVTPRHETGPRAQPVSRSRRPGDGRTWLAAGVGVNVHSATAAARPRLVVTQDPSTGS
jgi:hypothetical protein